MPDLAELRANLAELVYTYLGVAFTAHYRPVDLNDRTQAARRAMTADDDLEPMYAELARVVVDWDVTEHGEPVPTSPEGFKRAGIGVCIALWNALLLDMRNPTVAPGRRPAPPTGSSNGSRPAAVWAPGAYPTTTASSSTPAGSASAPGSSPGAPTPPATPSGSSGAIG